MRIDIDDVTIQLERIRALAIIGSCVGDDGCDSDHLATLLACIVDMAEVAQTELDALEYPEPSQQEVSQ